MGLRKFNGTYETLGKHNPIWYTLEDYDTFQKRIKKKIFDWLKKIITFKINKTHLKYEKKKG